MRLRLSIWRQELPRTYVLWSVVAPPSTGPIYTISRFLEQVNEIIPLEADEWGLEDYTLEIGGFECLHFSDVWNLLKDDDEIT